MPHTDDDDDPTAVDTAPKKGNYKIIGVPFMRYRVHVPDDAATTCEGEASKKAN